MADNHRWVSHSFLVVKCKKCGMVRKWVKDNDCGWALSYFPQEGGQVYGPRETPPCIQEE